MLRWKARGSADLIRDLAAMTIAGAVALVPCTLVAAALAATPAYAAVGCGIAGTLTLFAGVKFVRPEIKLLPGASAAALSGAALGLAFPFSPALGCLAFGALFGMAQASAHRTWSQKLGIMATTAAAALLGGVVFGHAVALLGPAAFAQPATATGLFGLFGFYMALGTLPAHVKVRRDLVGQTYAELAPGLAPEPREHVQRTHALYQRIQLALIPGEKMTEDQEEAFHRDLERLTLRIFQLAGKWSELDAHLGGSSPHGDLAARLAQVDRQIASVTDPAARESYEETRRALVARSGDDAELKSARERIVSSLGLYYTRLETLHVALVRLRVAGAIDTAPEIEALLTSVTQITEGLDAASRSLDALTAPVPQLARG